MTPISIGSLLPTTPPSPVPARKLISGSRGFSAGSLDWRPLAIVGAAGLAALIIASRE